MEDGAGLNTGVIVGILVLVCVLLLLAVDATCCFLNKCGLLMCLCGKPGTGTKGKDMEAGKAAFVKDESKEPIVEVRTEDGLTANHDAGGHSEPNETTPLTEPERLAEAAASVVDLPLSVATNSDTVTDTFDLSQSSPVSECTTLTSSLTAPPPDPRPALATGPETSTPKSFSQPLAHSLLSSDVPLVDLAEPLPIQSEAPSDVQSDAQITSPAFTAQEPPSPSLSTEKTPKEPEKEPAPASLLQNSHEPVPLFTSPPNVPSVNHELQLDGGPPQASETHLPQDGPGHALGTAAPQNEKIPEEEESRSEDEDLKRLQSEAVAPIAISLTNDMESKA